MLKQADKDKIKTTYGIDIDKLIEVIKADAEQDFTVPADITVIKNTDLEARDNNKVNEGKVAGETAGEKKGKELAAKAFRKKFGIEDTVGNDIEKVVEAVNGKVAKGDTGLQEQITLLQSDKQRLENEKKELESKASAATFDAELISYFPANRSTDMNDAERLAIVKMNLGFEDVNGVKGVKKNGQLLRDGATQNLLPVKQAVTDLFTERKWVGATTGGTGGRGGGDNTAGSGADIKSASKFAEKWKAENPGKSDISQEYMDALGAHGSKIPDFDFYS